MTDTRCPAAHTDDPTPCCGPVDAVTVLDARNHGAEGCEHHAARLLASLDGGRVYSGSVPEAAIRVFKAAAELPPFAYLRTAEPMVEVTVTGTQEMVRLAVWRLRQSFATVTTSPIHETGTEGVFAARAMCQL
jgi:hypothetical protein